MAITIELPEVEAELRARYGDLERAAREALIVDAYRRGHLSATDVGALTGRSYWETMEWFMATGVGPNYSPESLEEEMRGVRRRVSGDAR